MTWELTVEERAEWDKWVEERPADIAAVARQWPVWQLYQLRQTGQHCYVTGYQEADPDGDPMFAEVTVNIVAWQPWLGPISRRGVFGVKPEDLEVLEVESDE